MNKVLQLLLLLMLCLSGMAQTVNISGRVYFDNNDNHVFDAGDSAFRFARIYFYDGETSEEPHADYNGVYHISLPSGYYYYYINSYYDNNTYRNPGTLVKDYTGVDDEINDVIDIPFRKIRPVEECYISMQNMGGPDPIPTTSSVQQYRVEYWYSGKANNIPGVVSLHYSPFATFLSATPAPTLKRNGYLEWAVSNMESGKSDSIHLSFRYPAMGDTIHTLPFRLSFKPVFAGSDVVFERIDKQYIEQTEPAGVGATKGVKWLRIFSSPEESRPENFGNSIDTVKGSDDYFVQGEKYSPQFGGYSSFVARLNKDGLSVWELFLDSLTDGMQSVNGHSVKHTQDGGCIVTGTVANYTDGRHDDDVIVFKLDGRGALQWKRLFEGSGEDSYYTSMTDIAELADGGYLLIGDTESHDGDFANNNPDTLHTNVFISKLSATGIIIWTKVYGGNSDDGATRLLPLKNGTFLVLAATTSSNVTGAHSHGIQYIDERYTPDGLVKDTVFNPEAWLLNIDANGNVIWDNCYGGTGLSVFMGAAESNGGILLSGSTNSKNGDLPWYDAKGIPLWLLQISTTGQIVWSKIFPQYKGYNTTTDSLIYDNDNFGYFMSGLRKKKDGSFVVAGELTDKYGELKSGHGDDDIVIVNVSATGNIIWQKAIGGTEHEFIGDIGIDKNDDIVFVGSSASENDDLYVRNDGLLMTVGKLGITNTISGHVFTDLNGNHIKDGNEMYSNEGRIYSTKQNDTTIARIFGGQFLNNVDTGNYVTTYVPTSDYFTVFPASKNSAFNSFDQSDSVDFALVPKPNIKDLQTVITPLTPARPGFESNYRIITKNVGTTNITNAVISLKKDSRQTYTSASRVRTGIAVDSVWWGPFTINAFTNDTLDVVLTQKVPPTLQNGDTLSLNVFALPLANDTTPANNKVSLRQIVQGSFDPNDKTEAHAGIYTPTMKASNEPFQYLIRFQNTGTDTALYVTVKDTLDAKVDVNSLETITASHPYKFSLEGRIATWQFNKILLVDSTTNEPASHGFISFTIRPSAILKLGDSVSNKAAIYFDFNLPVITNKSLLVLVSDKSVICPGGSTQFQAGQTGLAYRWQIDTGNGFTNLSTGGIYTGAATGTLLISNAPSNLYGSLYRCVITLVSGNKMNSATYKLTFSNTWTGTVSTAWENASNWSCGTVPDENTDVMIKAGTPNTPTVNANTAVRSIAASAGAKVMVKAEVMLSIKGSQ